MSRLMASLIEHGALSSDIRPYVHEHGGFVHDALQDSLTEHGGALFRGVTVQDVVSEGTKIFVLPLGAPPHPPYAPACPAPTTNR